MTDHIDLRGIARDQPVQTAPDLVPRDLSFRVRYKTPDGVTYDEVLVSRVMSGQARSRIPVVVSRLTGGASWESVPARDRARAASLAQATLQIVEAPEWILRWMQEDANLLEKIAEVLLDHEERYFRGERATSGEPEERVLVEPIGAGSPSPS